MSATFRGTARRTALSSEPSKSEQRAPGWPEGWWRIMETRIGIIPLPVHLLLLAAVLYFLVVGKMPVEINVMIAVLAVFGFTCGQLGKRIPVLKAQITGSVDVSHIAAAGMTAVAL